MNQRMRQEDRLGKILSQLEQQRLTLNSDRLAIAAQMLVLSDEVSLRVMFLEVCIDIASSLATNDVAV